MDAHNKNERKMSWILLWDELRDGQWKIHVFKCFYKLLFSFQCLHVGEQKKGRKEKHLLMI